MSEINEFYDELKDRFVAWRQRSNSREEAPPLEEYPEVPGIEFTPLDPLSPPVLPPAHSFSELRLAWLETQCAPDVYAQGHRCYLARGVTRVHAHGLRMTGTTYEQRYEDQEILLKEGRLIASCTCCPTPSSPMKSPVSSPAASPESAEKLEATRTLRCRHVVAILLAYLNAGPSPQNTETTPTAQPSNKDTVCPITRQPLVAGKPLYQCSQCGISYSAEGWEFLRTTDKGRCCGCESRKTVRLVAG